MFSVVIPVHNSENTLRRCLDSLKRQTFDDYEAILVENGSTDNSLTICNEYAKMDYRFKVYSMGRCNGPSKPRNYAMNMAKGEFICFLDSDDWVEPFFLELYASALSNSDIAFCSYIVEDANGNVIREAHPKVSAINSREQSIELISSDCFGYSCCKAFKKTIYEDLRFDESLDLFEDSIFTTHLMAANPKLVTIDKVLYHYIVDNTQAITRIVHKDMISKKDMEFSAWYNFFGEEYTEFIVRVANDNVVFCKYYIYEHNLNLIESYRSIIKTGFYKTAIRKPNKDTSILEAGFLFFAIEYEIWKLKINLYRRIISR